VVFSYVRTIHAYPQGGGGYRVSSDNIGSRLGRVAGAALLIDYVLTVAVSVSSGVLAIASAYPATKPYIVEIGLMCIGIMAWVNLRGTRESGLVFAIPTYLFITLILGLIIVGLLGAGRGAGPLTSAEAIRPDQSLAQASALWIILRAFAAGCTALTGIEAIADGAGAFRPPEAVNASRTLILLGVVLTTLFVGVSWLASHYGVAPISLSSPNYKTVLAQLNEGLFGNGVLFYTLQITTMAILILAANTAFADFPRLCSFIARDSYMPRQLANLGDRLVYQNGILLLAVCAGMLIFVFHGDTHRLIPLYAVGVFTSFTLSQTGMVARQVRMKQPLWGIIASAIGAATTGGVMLVILITKFHDGAWIVVITATLLLLFAWVRRHYDYLAEELNVAPDERVPISDTTVLLLVPRIHRGVLNAISYARTLSHDCRAVHITINPESVPKMVEEWEKHAPDIPLVILESSYRSLVEPLMEYIDEAVGERPNYFLTVIVPQAVPKHWWQGILHNNAAIPIKMALASRKNVVITNLRYFLD
jgi:amino acid transporter